MKYGTGPGSNLGPLDLQSDWQLTAIWGLVSFVVKDKQKFEFLCHTLLKADARHPDESAY